ncbi:glycosyltransferase family 92 protein RCOM_0530710-like [Rhododendron vialii]|uniref:glycosyltransferase family 92 protein RCOM_0530710-like n=1 Tax=Rhododendron vialii TaxID=182163 RepID=UPI00265FAD1C|nr:glycosyltransferase family 92 protein RCOM_0530710-like [Rhododendron vialii]
MKDQRKRSALLVVALNRVLRRMVALVFFFVLAFCTLRLLLRGTFRPQLVSSWPTPLLKSINDDWRVAIVQETVLFPDQALIFLKYPRATPLFSKDDIGCVYFSPNSSQPHLNLQPDSIDGEDLDLQIVRCPLQPRGITASVGINYNGHLLAIGPTYRWDSLAYDALIDNDNTTIVFVKGLNLRPQRVTDPSRFKCVYGRDFNRSKLLLLAEVISIGQEIVRCKTPLSILSGSLQNVNSAIKVSVRGVGKPIMSSIARPDHRLDPNPSSRKKHQMCVCTMLRNQARFMREWVVYHARIGVQSWFIYDNNSDDDISSLIESLDDENFNITRHVWPWIKSQEAGFAHCALRARNSCEWIGFIDVDEFLHFPLGLTLHDVIGNSTSNVGELRVKCHSFGPSGLKRVPAVGVTQGYTCRMAAAERHKSIVRPEALNSTLINSVHHFHLTSGFEVVNVKRNVLVINHYKYQVWEVFKEKFYRRVATYVADWLEDENVGSKDRTPGLGIIPIEPPDWSTRFCEVVDIGLRDRVVEIFSDPKTQMLPWHSEV